MKLAAHAGIDELQVDLLADSLDVAVPPVLEGKRRSLAAALLHRTFVSSARRMGVNRVGGTVHNVNASAVGPPPGDPRRKMFVGIGNAAVVFFLVFILRGVRSGIAAQPELLD